MSTLSATSLTEKSSTINFTTSCQQRLMKHIKLKADQIVVLKAKEVRSVAVLAVTRSGIGADRFFLQMLLTFLTETKPLIPRLWKHERWHRVFNSSSFPRCLASTITFFTLISLSELWISGTPFFLLCFCSLICFNKKLYIIIWFLDILTKNIILFLLFSIFVTFLFVLLFLFCRW